MGKNPNDIKRMMSKRLYDEIIIDEVNEDEQVIARARKLEASGLRKMDAAHLAAAEAANADYLLTVDKDFIKTCAKPNITAVKVINPLFF